MEINNKIWNRIGDVASTIAKNSVKFGGELLGAQAAIPRLAFDIFSYPWRDHSQYNGFIDAVKQDTAGATKNLVKPFASAAGAVMKVPGVAPVIDRINQVNRDYIREPLTAFALAQGDLNAGRIEVTDFFDPKTWSKRYAAAQDISLGQAFVGAFRNAYDPKFNIYDPRERDAAFKQNFWGKTLSGGTDLFAQFFGDVSLAAGKVGKAIKASELGVGVLKNSDTIANAAEQITKAAAGDTNRFTKVLEDFAKNDSMYALNHPMVKSSSQPALLAHLLGDAVDKEEVGMILRSAMGDPVAMDELALQRAYMSDALKAARGDLNTVDEWKLFAAPDGSGMIPFLTADEAVIKEAKDNYASLAAHDAYFSKLMQLGEGTGSLRRTTGILSQSAEDFIAKARATKYYDKKVGNAKVEVFQPTPFHRMYQKISWLEGERPAGRVDFNDPDSYREIVATADRAKKILDLSEEESKAMVDTYIAARSPEERFAATIQLESNIFRKIADKHGISQTDAESIYNSIKFARTSALKSIKDNGFMVDLDGTILKDVQLESQTADWLPVMDFDLLNRVLKANSGSIRKLNIMSKDSILHSADVLQDMFKAGALLRLGYTIRNGIDSQLRIASAVGAMASLRHLGPGIKNIINNTVATPSRIIDKYSTKYAGMTLSDLQGKTNSLITELNDIKTKISEAKAKASLHPDDADLATKVNTWEKLQEEKQAVYDHYTGVITSRKGINPKQRIGTGTYEFVGTDGAVYHLPDAFGGSLGDMFRRLASSGNSFTRMVDSNSALYSEKLASKGIGVVKPGDKGYFEQWAQTLRQQFGNSAVARQLAAGKSVDDVAEWLRNSPAGRDLRKRLSITSDGSAEYVTRINNFFDQYLPVTSGLRGKLRDITPDDLRNTFKDPTTLPLIHGHVLKENFYNGSRMAISQVVNNLFHFLGTLPEDTWARNPLYIDLYRKEMQRRITIASGMGKKSFTAEEQQVMMNQAHKFALRDMKSTLFNIERKTNAAMLFKFASPFFSAQENAVKTWLKLAVANPAIVNRGYQVWNAPNRAGLVTDFEGNPVPAGKTTGNDIIWIQLPKGVSKIPFVGSGLQSLNKMGIPKQSLDVVFGGGLDALYNQGSKNVFSDVFPVGPFIGVPASEVVKRKPSLEDSMRFVLPYGAYDNALKALIPAWVQKAQVAQDGIDSTQFASAYQLIWATEQQKAKRNGLPPVSDEKIYQMTRDYWAMRTVANLVMPFAPQFSTPFKFWLDKAREYRRTYGLDADAQFFNDFPEYFDFTTRLTKNLTNIQSSQFAVARVKKYPELITQLSKIEPKLIGTITNDFTNYKFSQVAYTYLKNKQISPGSAEKFLGALNPQEAQQKTEAEKGWIMYNKAMDAINGELQNRGLSSIQSKGAEDLAIIKSFIIAKLSKKVGFDGKPIIDPSTGQYVQSAWSNDYMDSDGSKTNKVVLGLSSILQNDKFMKDNGDNPTWKSVGVYLQIRSMIAQQLAARQVKSIDAKANQDLHIIYDSLVNKLKKDDPLGFKYLYERFLSQDLVYDKYLTPLPGETK